MPKECSYCDSDVNETTGKMFLKQSGERFFFCNRKCEQNFLRNRNLKYTEKEKKVEADA